MRHQIRTGDYYSIALPDGRVGYAQLLQLNEKYGYLVRVLDRITSEPLSVSEVAKAKNLFPPVFVAIDAALKSGSWKQIGNGPVPDFSFPTFRLSPSVQAGTYSNWWLWDGGERRFIGRLPSELRSLEVETIWGHELLAERIATGFNYWDQVV